MCRRLISEPDYRAAYLRNIRDRTRGISACVSNYIPEEVVAAAGFHPLRIIGRYDVPRHHGQSLYTPICSFARDVFAAVESGAFSLVNNVIFPNSCDSLRVLRQMWEREPATPPVHALLHPICAAEYAVRYFARQIEDLAERLAGESGVSLAESRLANHVQRYNQTRRLLRQLYACGDGTRSFLRGSERVTLVTAGMIMDRGEYNQFLGQLLQEARNDDPRERYDGKRIMVIGPLLDNIGLLEEIEQLGATIVADDVTNGSRYFELDVESEGNLYENLARRYLRSGASPTMYTDAGADEQVFRQCVSNLSPDGVIFVNQKFCEPHVHNYLAKRQILTQMKVPTLMLEVEHDRMAVTERDLLRIEPFMEMLNES